MVKKKRCIAFRASPAGVTARGTASEAVGWEDLISFPPVAVPESIDDAVYGGAPVAPAASPDVAEAVPPSTSPSLLTSPSAVDADVSAVAPAASTGCASSLSAALEVSVAVGASPVRPHSVADAMSGSSNAVSGSSNAASTAIGLKASSMRMARLRAGSRQIMCSSASIYNGDLAKKLVWLWTENADVMTAAVERGWNTFVFSSEPRSRKLANEWSSMAMIHPLFVKGSEIIDAHNVRVAVLYDVSSPRELKLLLPDYQQDNTVVINFQSEWQVIPAENIVAAIQGCGRSFLAVSTTSSEAQVFLEALEQGLDGVVLKVAKLEEVFKLKDYFNRRNDLHNFLELTKATITKVEVVGMGDRVCIDLCSLMKPGEGLLVGSFARGLFLIHSECLESNYIASRPFRVNAGPVHSYVAVPGGKTSYLSELRARKEVIVANQSGLQRTAIVGRLKIETRPLILLEAMDSDNMTYSIFVQNVETVGLVCPHEGEKSTRTAIPVTSLKCGDDILLRVQGGARHTGIEIQEFIIEK